MTERQKVTALSSRSGVSGPVAMWKFVGIAVLIFLVLFSIISITIDRLQQKPVPGVILPASAEALDAELPATIHSFFDRSLGWGKHPRHPVHQYRFLPKNTAQE
jgi:hypothetical protein